MPERALDDPTPPTYDSSGALDPQAPPPFEPTPVTPASTEPAQVTVKLVLESKDGAAVRAESVTIEPTKGVIHTGEPRFLMRPVAVTVKNPDGTTYEDSIGALDEAKYVFGRLEPDHYELKVRLPDGQCSRQPLLIRDDKPLELTIVCPAPRRKATLRVTMPPLPEDLQKPASDVNIWIEPHSITLDGVEWNLPNPLQQEIRFDPTTGRAMELCQTFDEDRARGQPYTSIDLRKSKDEDCVVFVLTGPVGIYYSTTIYGDRVCYPRNSELIPRQVKPGENRWEIELPDEFLALARASKVRMPTEDEPGPRPLVVTPDGVLVEPPPKQDGPAHLTVKLVPESKTGLVSRAQVSIKSAESQHVSTQVEGADPAQFVFHSLDVGYYELEVRLADGQRCTRPLLIEDEKPRDLKIVCPGPRKRVATEMTMTPLPEKLREKGYGEVEMYVWAGPVEVGETRWTSSSLPAQKIRFDASTGKPLSIEVSGSQRPQTIDLRHAPDDERRVFLPAGVAGYGFCVTRRTDGQKIVWPGNLNTDPSEANEGLKYVIKPGEPKWNVELPQQYLEYLEHFGEST
jgi:hypothetical protein